MITGKLILSYVAEKSSKETYNVSVLRNDIVKYNCRGFKFTHITVLRRFCRISVISEFSFLGIGLTTKPGNHGKSLFSGLQSSNTY